MGRFTSLPHTEIRHAYTKQIMGTVETTLLSVTIGDETWSVTNPTLRPYGEDGDYIIGGEITDPQAPARIEAATRIATAMAAGCEIKLHRMTAKVLP